MKRLVTIFLGTLLTACVDSGGSTSDDEGTALHDINFPTTHTQTGQGALRPIEDGLTYNKEAVIPPMCYTKHEAAHNPCMVCHQTYPFDSRPNSMGDGGLQSEYAFSDLGERNHWLNLFEDRSAAVASITDQEAIDYIHMDNYSTLIEQLKSSPDWSGPIPALENLHLGPAAFDPQGFALDGSHWVAFNYKPMPSTFWPTNGSTDDVMVRLPAAFREQCCNGSSYSRDTYIANLAILEMAIQDLISVTVPPIDENAFCTDLNGDNQLGIVSEILRPTHYVGNASATPVTPMLYPEGTEFLHTVRYVGIDSQGNITLPPRMKEVRYMRKHHFFTPAELVSLYGNERQEKIDELLPVYLSRGDQGVDNGFGWMVLGFIEAKEGHLRKQSEEELRFCMGCHTTIGTTIDQTFAFPRKVTGATGWGYINLRGMKDAPSVGGSEGEILHYLKRVGGGNEFRGNGEIVKIWFNADGTLNVEKVKSADVYQLITPSAGRALTLNKAYMTIVQDQDFIHGRDATVTPATNVYQVVDPLSAPTLPPEKRVEWDIRLDW